VKERTSKWQKRRKKKEEEEEDIISVVACSRFRAAENLEQMPEHGMQRNIAEHWRSNGIEKRQWQVKVSNEKQAKEKRLYEKYLRRRNESENEACINNRGRRKKKKKKKDINSKKAFIGV